MDELADCRGNETILIVDDEEYLRIYLSDVFSYLGYEVIIAQDGGEAVDIYIQYKKIIDLVVMDILMPIKDGISAYREIKEINNDAKILLYSGNPVEYSHSGLDVEIMNKPLSKNELARKVRATLNLT